MLRCFSNPCVLCLCAVPVCCACVLLCLAVPWHSIAAAKGRSRTSTTQRHRRSFAASKGNEFNQCRTPTSTSPMHIILEALKVLLTAAAAMACRRSQQVIRNNTRIISIWHSILATLYALELLANRFNMTMAFISITTNQSSLRMIWLCPP